ncbi:LysM peptidoglycan-binding domain-containing protein [Blastococcus sp. TF02A-35]|uniref:LysM peptidoglycan-binding domain-containing protein n=1 Tax=Blastococcus sp. TF02A-35 TaxID=2559612 RepID=UPI001073FE1B|nr:LysM peptidoglycan-binding domain-containing protein [Blastococcus sp. TF02A_35]TFV47509.1 LysM peptidoglycan-binding domain-containing protein [Blastococcus sp. TF02A_35]
MTRNAALRTAGVPAERSGQGSARGALAAPPRERHLRVLPPPAAYAVAPAPASVRAEVRTAAGRPAGDQAPRLRLTARGRRLVAVLALACGVGLVALGDALAGDGGDGLELMGTSSVVVERGDTLWGIALSVAGDDDVREVVDRIVELNSLEGGEIVPGQVLVLP